MAASYFMRHFGSVLFLLVCLPAVFAAEPANSSAPTWSLQPDDRIVLLGNTFIERENEFGRIELSLRLANPALNFQLRNLGWSGDNVFGESRAYFGPVKAGYAHLQEYVNLLKPTVLFVSYGHNEAFDGEKALPAFLQNYDKLLTDLQAENRRVIVLGLTPLEPVHRTPETTNVLNQQRRLFNKGIQKLCEQKQLPFIDLFDSVLVLQKELNIPQLTENGVHLNAEGYTLVGEAILQAQGKSLLRNKESLLQDSQFQALSQPLAEKIQWKNELFFHRFRPQNETYLRGFRKHEQGQNAKEIYEFDPLVEQEEQQLQPQAENLLKQWNAATTPSDQ